MVKILDFNCVRTFDKTLLYMLLLSKQGKHLLLKILTIMYLVPVVQYFCKWLH